MTGLTFADALDILKLGKRLSRKGWVNKQSWIELQRDKTKTAIYLNTPTSERVLWTISQVDVLSEDWYIV